MIDTLVLYLRQNAKRIAARTSQKFPLIRTQTCDLWKVRASYYVTVRFTTITVLSPEHHFLHLLLYVRKSLNSS